MENIELIVLSFTRTGGDKVVVHTLSRAYGRRAFLVHGFKKATKACFLPLAIVEADVAENPRSSLATLRGLQLKEALADIRSDLYKNIMTIFLGEVLLRILPEGNVEEGLYDWTLSRILTLEALEGESANFPVWFLLDLAGALGFRPSWDDVAPFAKGHETALKPFLEQDFAACMLLPLTGAVRSGLCACLLDYLSFHTGQTLQVNSLEILRTVLE